MNFLSHYYLHNDNENNYLTVGLTIPDLLGFHSVRIRINQKFLENIYLEEKNESIKSFIHGMMIHLSVDRWFHNSTFFNEKLLFLQDNYTGFNEKKEKLSNFYAHIILEILIDRYLLNIQPDIADRFYQSYKEFNFPEIACLFAGLKDFDKDKFIKLAIDVSNSNFLREYIDDYLIISILKRVSKRIQLPLFLEYEDDDFAGFIKDSYEQLEPSIKSFIEKAKEEVILDNIRKKSVYK